MNESEAGGVPRKKFPHIIYLGHGMLLACAPMTSATEVSVSSDILGFSMLGWLDQIAFVLCFIIVITVLGAFSSKIDSLFSPKLLLPISLLLAELGVAVYALAAFAAIDPGWVILGSALRGLGHASLIIAWFELFVDIAPRVRHSTIVLPLSLLVAALFGILIWLLSAFAGAEITFLALALLPACSLVCLYVSRRSIVAQSIPHLVNKHNLKMPPSTRWIILVFGLALGCTWAVFYSIQGVNLPLWACLAFLLLSAFMVVGIATFMPRRELNFGFALRWTMLLTVAGFLALPIIIQSFPSATAFLLALAWSAQILLLALMPVQISSLLPVNMLSVAWQGGVSYGIGAAIGSLAASGVFSLASSTHFAYSIITALVCLCFAIASLYFPARNTDASVLGMETVPENELHAERVERRSKEVSEKWGLTTRENEVMYLMALGKSRSQIAEEFNISEETVKTHSKHIYEKLDVHSLRELVTLIENGTL